ncbi:partial putative signaling protein, partial [uncultured bacterium]
GVPYTVLYPRNYGVDFYSDMLFTHEQELREHPERVKAFLHASLLGWQYALNHPDKIINLLQTQYQVPKTKKHLEFEAKAIRNLIEPNLVEIGHINPWRLQHMSDTFVQANMVKNTDLLHNFIYQPDAAKDQLKHHLKIAIVTVVVISLIATVFYFAYLAMKRENYHRKRIEEKLRQRTNELALHNNILQKISQGITLTDLLEELAKQVEQIHPRMMCSILLLDENGKLQHGAAPSLPEFYNQTVDGLSIGDGIGSCGTAAYRGERCIVEDIQQHPFWTPFRDLAEQAGVRACWSQPIKDNQGNVLGTFAIYHAAPNKPKDTEINLIESYASLAQIAIERTCANQALQESEQRLRLVLKGGDLGFWDWKLDSQKIEINTSDADVFCYPTTPIQTTPPDWLNFIYPDDREKTWQSIQKVLNGEQDNHQIEYRVLDKQGNIRWILDRANIVQQDIHGKPIRMSGTHTDITERKFAEQQLRDSEQRLNLCQFYGGIGTWEADLNHNQQTWSPVVTQLLGFPEFQQPTWDDFLSVIHPDDRQIVIDSTDAHIKQGKKYDVTYRIINTNKQIRWMRSVGCMDSFNSHEQSCYFRGIVQDVTELKEAEAQIKQLAYYDPLTQLPNRRLLSDRLCCAINKEKNLAILMMDLDRFKAVNDSLGHAVGDELLEQVANRISNQLTENDTAARLGGDEFVILLPDIDQQKVEHIALAVIQTLSQPFILKDTEVNIGTSIGISFYPKHGNNPDQLLDYADAALYQAKYQGRGCFCIAPN